MPVLCTPTGYYRATFVSVGEPGPDLSRRALQRLLREIAIGRVEFTPYARAS